MLSACFEAFELSCQFVFASTAPITRAKILEIKSKFCVRSQIPKIQQILFKNIIISKIVYQKHFQIHFET